MPSQGFKRLSMTPFQYLYQMLMGLGEFKQEILFQLIKVGVGIGAMCLWEYQLALTVQSV